MNYFLGIDGGGTKTEALLSDEEGFIIGRGKSGASNPKFVGEESALQAVSTAVKEAVKDIELKKIKRTAFCIPSSKSLKEDIVAQFSFRKEDVVFTSDVKNTFYGALVKENGVVVLTGTGSFALGINRNLEEYVVGGWGPIIGDPGSGQWIGARALQAAARHYDGYGPKTRLTELICERFDLQVFNQIKGRHLSIDMVSKLAPLVKKAAEKGNNLAKSIIKESAQELADMALVVIKQLKMDEKDYSLALTGGIANFGEILWRPFAEKIGENCSSINVIKPRVNPVIGSILLAMKENNVEWSPVIINNLINTYREVAGC